MRVTLFLVILSIVIPVSNIYAGGAGGSFFLNETDTSSRVIYTPFDLRDRESFVQVTNTDDESTLIHVQIYNVGNLCNENNFFDVYTPNDTHVYNLRDLLSNDNNPTGVVLPEDAYGIVFISAVPADGGRFPFVYSPIVGNFRIEDNSGYEYRSNAQSFLTFTQPIAIVFGEDVSTFNYNSENGVVLSDVFGIPLSSEGEMISIEATLDNVLNTFAAVDVDIIDQNEVLFSCRDVVFACIDDSSPLLEELLQLANNSNAGPPARSSASVAAFEYGINDVIPNTKGGELLCPGNVISDGIVRLTLEGLGEQTFSFAGYVGLNNGNGRGSMDSLHSNNLFTPSNNF